VLDQTISPEYDIKLLHPEHDVKLFNGRVKCVGLFSCV